MITHNDKTDLTVPDHRDEEPQYDDDQQNGAAPPKVIIDQQSLLVRPLDEAATSPAPASPVVSTSSTAVVRNFKKFKKV